MSDYLVSMHKAVNILVVEDSPTQLEALKHLLETLGFSVITAHNGKEGLAAVAANAIDLVISDIVMPEMDGYGFCKALRADETFKHLPVILLTSLADPRDVIQGLESGADNFICKPYEDSALLTRVQNVLANQEIRKTTRSEMGINIVFAGQRFFITADRLQILDLLLSTYENAVSRNNDLIRARNELQNLNDQLEARVAERTKALVAEIEERKRAEEAIRSSENRFRALFETIAQGVVFQDGKGSITSANPAAQRILGCTLEQMQGMNSHDLRWKSIHEDGSDFIGEDHPAMEALRTGQAVRDVIMGISNPALNGVRLISIQAIPLFKSGDSLPDEVYTIFEDITESRQARKKEQLSRETLEVLNRSDSTEDAVRDILMAIQKTITFDAVGIRLRDGDDFPYYVTNGFEEDFLLAERYLCPRDTAGKVMRDKQGNPILECMCGNILCGRTDPAQPFFTSQGSFWTNSTTHLLATTTEADRQAHTRNRCTGAGYESVALIPLKAGETIIGSLQLNDRQTNRFTLEMIQYFEGLGAIIGIALSRKQAEQALMESEARFRTFTERTPDGVFMVDETGLYTQANRSACRITGFPEEELLRMSANDLVAEESMEEGRAHFSSVMETGAATSDLWHKHKDGSKYCLTVDAVKISETQILGFCKDITKRKQAEELVGKQLEELLRWQDVMLDREDRVQEIKREVNELCRRLDEGVRYPSQEVASVDSARSSP